MSDQNPFKPSSSTLGIFVVAVLVAAIGLYTKNIGFFVAGLIFFCCQRYFVDQPE